MHGVVVALSFVWCCCRCVVVCCGRLKSAFVGCVVVCSLMFVHCGLWLCVVDRRCVLLFVGVCEVGC